MNDLPKKLLIIDDDSIFRLGLVTALQYYNDLRDITQTPLKNALTQVIRPDLILIDPGAKGWSVCQSVLRQYRDIPICLFTTSIEPSKLPSLRRENNLLNYCPKGISIDRLVVILRHLLEGGKYWSTSKRFLPPQQWLINWREYGLEQIEDNLDSISKQLENNPNAEPIDRFFWQGRKRELKVVRWLVNQLLPVTFIMVPPELEASPSPLLLNASSTPASIYDNTLIKLQSIIINASVVVIEIDILNQNKRQELLYLVLENFKKTVEDIRLFKLELDDNRKNNILQILWEESTISFLKRNLGLKEKQMIDQMIAKDLEVVQNFILSRIPAVIELLQELLDPQQIEEKNKQIMLENLLIQIANAVMSVVLNNLSESEEVKKELYDSKLMSSREIARFRNLLAWRYRQDKYWDNPQDIFTSQYRFFYLEDREIKVTYLYASRQEELNKLRGFAWLITISLELRDAISPRFRSLVAWIGKGLVYILTEVVGKGIGLIGRGVVQGIGNALQDSKNKKS